MNDIDDLVMDANKALDAVYYNDVNPLSRLEKESKYSSTLLPTGGLPTPRNSYDSRQLPPPLSDFSLPSLEVELGEDSGDYEDNNWLLMKLIY